MKILKKIIPFLLLYSCQEIQVKLATPADLINDPDDSSDPAVITSTLLGAPIGSSGSTSLNISVGGTEVEAYRFKIGPTATTDCASMGGYSTELPITTLITEDISGLPDGGLTVCSLGKSSEGDWQLASAATSANWTKSTTLKTIHRSIGRGNTTALATGTGNSLSIIGNMATFSSALPTNVGVGDAIQYDSDNDTNIDAIAFISYRFSSSTFAIRNAAGDTPTPVVTDQAWSIFRAYTSLSNGYGGTENTGIDLNVRNFDNWGSRDLVANNEFWNFAMYADAPDPAGYFLQGWTTGPQNQLRIFTPFLSTEVGSSQRHTGLIGTGFSMNGNFWIRDNYVRFEGLSINATSGGNNDAALCQYVLATEASQGYVLNNIIRISGTHTGVKGIWVGTGSDSYLNEMFIINNIIINEASDTSSEGIFFGFHEDGAGGYDKNYVYNNTIYSENGVSFRRNASDVDYRNNIAYTDSGNDCFGDYGGSGSTYGSNNAANCATVSVNIPAGVINRLSQTFTFMDELNNNFLLSLSDTGAKGFGTDLSSNGNFNFSKDILNAQRSIPWDIGASIGY